MNSLKFGKLTGLNVALAFIIFVVAIFVIIANDNVISTIFAYIFLSGLVTLAINYNLNGEITGFKSKAIMFFIFLALFPSIAWLVRQIAS
jgi:hypothetical protein